MKLALTRLAPNKVDRFKPDSAEGEAVMFLGIDVSKKTLDVALLSDHPKPQHKVFANDAAGHEELVAWLGRHSSGAVHACLEATGTWATGVALALDAAGHRVSLVNPAQIHAFGRSGLKRTKTDKADALLIARFCAMHQPPAWTPLSPQLEQLQGLIRRLEHLDEMLTMEKNRLSSGSVCGAVEQSITRAHRLSRRADGEDTPADQRTYRR